MQEFQAGNNSDRINDENIVILDTLLEYECISKNEHKQILIKCDLLHI